jgi:putative PIN family toxin of toxin-antitoxin system
VIDTNVLVAGIAGFKPQYIRGRNASADLLYRWAGGSTFTWLVSEDILDEYKEILRRRNVRSALIGQIINLIRERAEVVRVATQKEISPDPKDNCFCNCAHQVRAEFIVTLNPRDFPQDRLKAKVLSPTDFLKL